MMMANINVVGCGRLVRAVEGKHARAVLVEQVNAIELCMLYGMRVAAAYLRANGWSLEAAKKVLL